MRIIEVSIRGMGELGYLNTISLIGILNLKLSLYQQGVSKNSQFSPKLRSPSNVHNRHVYLGPLNRRPRTHTSLAQRDTRTPTSQTKRTGTNNIGRQANPTSHMPHTQPTLTVHVISRTTTAELAHTNRHSATSTNHTQSVENYRKRNRQLDFKQTNADL